MRPGQSFGSQNKNVSSVTVQLGDSARTMDTRESYEQTYNTGCNYASVGDWTAAEEALTNAEKAAREDGEGEVDERSARDKETQTIYNQNIFDSKKRIKVATVECLDRQSLITQTQKSMLTFSQHFLGIWFPKIRNYKTFFPDRDAAFHGA